MDNVEGSAGSFLPVSPTSALNNSPRQGPGISFHFNFLNNKTKQNNIYFVAEKNGDGGRVKRTVDEGSQSGEGEGQQPNEGQAPEETTVCKQFKTKRALRRPTLNRPKRQLDRIELRKGTGGGREHEGRE
jgi:hypothetical protein